MKYKSYHDGAVDLSTALWVSFWLFILTTGDPDVLDAVIGLIGRIQP